MINVGIVGLGFMAATHIRAYEQVHGVRVRGICNPSGRHLDGDFSDVLGNLGGDEPLRLDMSQVKSFRDYEAMLADPELHLIDVCSPTWVHADHAIKALAAGKHVLLEKPMARTTEEARRLVSAAKAADTTLMPAMCMRFWPEWQFLRECIVDQRFGRCLAARFRRVSQPPAWGKGHFLDGSKSGGALLDLHIHDVDFVHCCFGRPTSVYATGYQKFSGAIDHVVAQYEFNDGPIVHAEGGWAMSPGFGFNMSYTANFERATLDYDVARGGDALKVFEEDREPTVVQLGSDDGYVGEIRQLVSAIHSGDTSMLVTAADGLTALEICEAEDHSIRRGERVTI